MATTAATRTSGKGRNLTTKAYDSIRRDILTGRLEPGSPLRVNSLAAEREVSLSVVREALARLSAQGLVTFSPNQGFRVVSLSIEDLADLTGLRVELEEMALTRSIKNGTLQWEADVVSAHHVLDGTDMFEPGSHLVREEWAVAHTQFHDALLDACGSPRLLSVISDLNAASDVYRQWAVEPGIAAGRDVAAEHRRLMEFTTARRTDEATSALRAHLELTSEMLRVNAEQGRTAD